MYSLIATDSKAGTANGVTTDGVDTTAATFIVINVGWFSGITTDVTVTSSKAGTITPLTKQHQTVGLDLSNQLFILDAPTVGAGHTFSASGTGTFPSIEVLAWSGSAASPTDQQNGTHQDNVPSLATGNVTPTLNNELVIAGAGHDNNSGFTLTINGGFTATTIPYSVGNCEGSGIAYLIQTTATAANPTWDLGGANAPMAVTIATFMAVGQKFILIPGR